MSNPLNTKLAKVYVIEDGVGFSRGNPHDVIADISIGMGDVTESLGGLTRHYDKDPNTLQWRSIGVTRGKPEAITFPLTMKMRAWNKMEKYGPDDELSVMLSFLEGGDPTDPLNYASTEVYTNVYIDDRSYSRGATDGQEDEEHRTLTVNMNASDLVRFYKNLSVIALATGLTGPDDVDITAAAVAYDGTIYLATAVDDTPTNPYLIIGTPQRGGGISWTSQTLTDLSADVDSVIVMGDAIVIASGVTVSRAERSDLTAWVDTTAAGAINKLVAINAAEAVALGAAGLMMITNDGGLSWTTVTTGVSEALNNAVFMNSVQGIIVGDAGTILRYNQGLVSVEDDPTSGANITAIAVRPNKKESLVLGCADATLWSTHDDGDNWEQVRYPGDAAGSVAAVGFGGAYGAGLWILHTEAGGSSRLLRDLCGGAGGANNVEIITMPTNAGYVDLVVYDQNDVLLVGAVSGGTGQIVRVAANG